MVYRIPVEEHQQRKETLVEKVQNDGYDGVVLFQPLNVQYITGFYHLPRERPVAVGITEDSVNIVVPSMEKEHAESDKFIHDSVFSYFEYPQSDPMETVKMMVQDLKIADKEIVADSDGSPSIMGYQGPALSEVVSGTVEEKDYITDMRELKSENEIGLIREASKWARLGHQVLHNKIDIGKRPETIGHEAQAEASQIMLDTLGDRYEMVDWHPPILCKLTAGKITGQPHNVNRIPPIEEGDNVVTVVKPTIDGYLSELERTMFVGEPDDEQRHYFSLMKKAQEIAIDTIEPGVEYAEVERRVVDYFEEHGVQKYAKHHIGHNIGLEGHERPYLDIGYEGEIRAGELFSIEPGFYIPEIGGFRHSDTIAVTESGVEELTYYPKEIDDLVIDV